MKEFLSTIRNIFILLLFIFIIFQFFIGFKMAPNDDMKPRISAGDFLLYYKLETTYRMNDVVVLKKNDTEYVGRIVALPGDTVNITKDEAFEINGNVIIDDSVYYKTPMYEGFVTYPVKLSSDEFFILVDYREGGEDSRYYGVVKESELKGNLIGQIRKGNF